MTAPSGIRFALEGIDEITFAKVLRDVMHDTAFARPLQIQGQPSEDAALTLVFDEADRAQAIAAMQRLKTIMLRYGVQIDSIRLPGDEGKAL